MADSDRNRHPINPTRLYNPYQDLQLPHHQHLQTFYNIATSPEYLFAEEYLRQRRSWGENLTYYTGSSYLSGSLIGGAAGLSTAFRSFEPTDTLKLKINRVLNACGHSGRLWGNRIGVVGLVYAGAESGVVAMRDVDDVWSSVAAGLATGTFCRAARGVRSAAVGGALGGVVAGMAVAGKQMLKRYAMI